MKINKRRVLFTSFLVIALVAIAIVCLIVGRGHTVYFDNYDIVGTDYKAYESIVVKSEGEKIGTVSKEQRVSLTLTGQKLEVEFVIQKTESSSKETKTFTIELPYSMDGIIINLPAFIEGADQNVYMSEFIPAAEEVTEEEEVPITDEFGMTTDE